MNDPEINIEWPLKLINSNVLLAEKDKFAALNDTELLSNEILVTGINGKLGKAIVNSGRKPYEVMGLNF